MISKLTDTPEIIDGYVRLSRDDNKRNYSSIENQKKIIQQYAEENNMIIRHIYEDDGISGYSFNRPDFQKMMASLDTINIIVAKDLSRIGRHNAKVLLFLEEMEEMGKRVILIDDNYDSFYSDDDIIGIKTWDNERHVKNTSRKVKRIKRMEQESGTLVSQTPFGYTRHPLNKQMILIDEEAAEVVRDIFAKFLDGMSKNAIVHYLNEHGVLPPAAYKRERLGLKYQNPSIDPAKRPLWGAVTITTILKNRMYCGDMVQGRYRVKSYKIHVQEVVPEDEWYIVENTHEAIIDRDIFVKVQRLLLRDTRTAPQKKQIYLFSGFLRCADCGKAMTRSKVGGTVYYYCRTYKDQSKNACTKHTIKHNRLEAAVLYAVQQQVYLAVDYTKTIERINRAPLVKSQSKKLADAIEQKERELSKIARYKQAIYQDWKDGEISHSDYRHMKEDYEEQAEALNEVIEKLRAEQAELENGIDTENPFLKAFRQYGNIEKLTRDVLIELAISRYTRAGTSA